MPLTFGYAESSGRVRIFYLSERGSGTPLLISHALFNPGASTMMQFEPALAFNRALADGASWYMYDCRNSGRSSESAEPPTFNDLVDDLEAVADLIGEPFDVYGRTDGCALAVALAARRPESVRRLLLVSALRVQHDWKRVPESAQRVLRSFAREPVSTLTSHLLFGHPGANRAAALEAAKRHMEAMPMDVGRALQRAFVGIDLRDLGQHVQAPALLLSQEDEVDLTLEAARCLPNAQVEIWNQLGDGTVNGSTWRRAWDELFPPADGVQPVRPVSGSLSSAGNLTILPSPVSDREFDAVAVQLSPREAQVLALIAEGKSNRQIADTLVISSSTVATHIHHILEKVGVTNRAAATAWAVRHGMGASQE